MKKRTLNAQRPTPNIEWFRVSEDDGVYRSKAATLNAQRSTLNVQRPISEQAAIRFGGSAARLQRADNSTVDSLPNTRAANHIAGQLLRCGTSPYGNHGEVEAAESRKDFVHKLKVCLKELKETRRWLRLLARSSMLPETKFAPILNETEELIRIFFSSIRTAERNAK